VPSDSAKLDLVPVGQIIPGPAKRINEIFGPAITLPGLAGSTCHQCLQLSLRFLQPDAALKFLFFSHVFPTQAIQQRHRSHNSVRLPRECDALVLNKPHPQTTRPADLALHQVRGACPHNRHWQWQ